MSLFWSFYEKFINVIVQLSSERPRHHVFKVIFVKSTPPKWFTVGKLRNQLYRFSLSETKVMSYVNLMNYFDWKAETFSPLHIYDHLCNLILLYFIPFNNLKMNSMNEKNVWKSFLINIIVICHIVLQSSDFSFVSKRS